MTTYNGADEALLERSQFELRPLAAAEAELERVDLGTRSPVPHRGGPGVANPLAVVVMDELLPFVWRLVARMTGDLVEARVREDDLAGRVGLEDADRRNESERLMLVGKLPIVLLALDKGGGALSDAALELAPHLADLQVRPHSSDQLSGLERLRDVVVRAEKEGVDSGLRTRLSGQKDDRDEGRFRICAQRGVSGDTLWSPTGKTYPPSKRTGVRARS